MSAEVVNNNKLMVNSSIENLKGRKIDFLFLKNDEIKNLQVFTDMKIVECDFDKRPVFLLRDGRYLSVYFKNGDGHLFSSFDDMKQFFDPIHSKGIALWYHNAMPIYFYILKHTIVKEVFSSSSYQVVFSYFNDLYHVVNVTGIHGVFILTNNGHFNQAHWYPNEEVFNIDYEKMKPLFG